MKILTLAFFTTLGIQAQAIECPEPTKIPVDGKLELVKPDSCKVVSDKHGVADHCALRVTRVSCVLQKGGTREVLYFSDYVNTRNQPPMCVHDLPNSGFRSKKEDDECTKIGTTAMDSPKLWIFGPDDVSKDKEAHQDRLDMGGDGKGKTN